MSDRTRIIAISLIAIIFLTATFIYIKSISAGAEVDSARYAMLCDDHLSQSSSNGWHMVIFLDIHACLSCTEDMNAWRELEGILAQNGGTFSLYTRREDSTDVAWAMKLENLQSEVKVLDVDLVRELELNKRGTPLKILMDNRCRVVKIAGRMGNVRESKCFLDTIKQQVGIHSDAGPSLN